MCVSRVVLSLHRRCLEARRRPTAPRRSKVHQIPVTDRPVVSTAKSDTSAMLDRGSQRDEGGRTKGPREREGEPRSVYPRCHTHIPLPTKPAPPAEPTLTFFFRTIGALRAEGGCPARPFHTLSPFLDMACLRQVRRAGNGIGFWANRGLSHHHSTLEHTQSRPSATVADPEPSQLPWHRFYNVQVKAGLAPSATRRVAGELRSIEFTPKGVFACVRVCKQNAIPLIAPPS